MIKKTTAALILAAVALVSTACDTAANFKEVVNIHPAWVEDGPGGTIPNGCAPDGKTWAVVVQKYRNEEHHKVIKVGGPETVCTTKEKAQSVRINQRWLG